MARNRKKRTHVNADQEKGTSSVPRSFIVKHGRVGLSLTRLVRDMRKVMEPYTASRLKERNKNKLKDYLSLGPALQVTHVMAVTLTPIAPCLHIIRLSNGPTLSFRVERYSLMKDVLKSSRRPPGVGLEYLTSPLLVLASFPPSSPSTPPHIPLIMKSFQSLFPPLSPHTLSLSSARRVVLVSWNTSNETINIRHYIIKVKPYGVSRRVRRVLEGVTTSSGILDLGNKEDVADFLIGKRAENDQYGYDTGVSSAESNAGDDADAIDLVDDYVGRNNKRGQRRAVRLEEVGPRLELKLLKITEGVPGKEGSVIYHNLVKKTKEEQAEQKIFHMENKDLKRQRREEQERNVRRKLESAGALHGADEEPGAEEGMK